LLHDLHAPCRQDFVGWAKISQFSARCRQLMTNSSNTFITTHRILAKGVPNPSREGLFTRNTGESTPDADFFPAGSFPESIFFDRCYNRQV
jgi:hypothetical protein